MPTERIGLTSLPLKELLASDNEHTLTWKRKFADVTPQPNNVSLLRAVARLSLTPSIKMTVINKRK